jgi:phytoene synthase
MTDGLAASYRACHQVVRQSGSNFALAFWLLRRDKRQAMDALYAFARRTDDLGDDEETCIADRAQQLHDWRAQLRMQLTGHETGDPLLPAIADTARRYPALPALLEEIIDGVERDLTPVCYDSWPQLQTYCYQVAGAVGLACLHVWGMRNERPLKLAAACGEAFQLTNVLRDLKEDAERARVYLPQEDLARFKYSAADLQAGVADERFDTLMDFELARAEQLYATAAPLHDDLSRDGQRVFRLMFGRYRAILACIRQRPRIVLERRIHLSLPHKLWIAGRKLAASQP